MQVHYTGRKANISELEKQKLQRKFDKVHRILGHKLGSEAHVVIKRQRHLYEAEVTLNALSHTLVVTVGERGWFRIRCRLASTSSKSRRSRTSTA